MDGIWRGSNDFDRYWTPDIEESFINRGVAEREKERKRDREGKREGHQLLIYKSERKVPA